MVRVGIFPGFPLANGSKYYWYIIYNFIGVALLFRAGANHGRAVSTRKHQFCSPIRLNSDFFDTRPNKEDNSQASSFHILTFHKCTRIKVNFKYRSSATIKMVPTNCQG